MVTLRTERLLLEAVADEDSGALREHWADPGVRQYLWDGKIVSHDQVEETIAGSTRLFQQLGVGLWAIRSHEKKFIGSVGFWHFHDPPQLELVISLAPLEWGKGLATEACEAMIQHAFADLGWDSVRASTDGPNFRSLELLRRLGMEHVETLPGPFGTTEVFRRESS